MTKIKALCVLMGGAVTLATAPSVLSDTLDVYTGPEITNALKADYRACLNVGDAISCSAGMLNVLTGRAATNQTDASQPSKWGYVLASPQGALKDRIVLGTGGNASTDNGDIDPTNPPVANGSRVEDGYKTNNAGDTFAATGKDGVTAGNLADPGNNALPGAWDQKGTWDVGLDWLVNALTINGQRRELMIAFDYNQTKNATSSLDYWSLITLIDYDTADASTDSGYKEKNYEIKKTLYSFLNPTQPYTNFDAVADFISTKSFNDKPDASEFATVNTKTCYKTVGGVVVDVQPITGGQCSQFGADYETVNNAQGDNSTEILAFLPELNDNLEKYRDQDGFDAISVRMLFGCFGGADPKAGQGYLNSGATTNCDGGGNVDVYLLANVPMEAPPPPPPVPEPHILALLGLGLVAMGVSSSRRRRASV